jgi:predicted AlkP superfamily phosphohydrolase/phosphomutase
VQAQLFGPQNSFRQGSPTSAADFTVFVDPEHPVTKIRVQDRQILLQEGEWSDWVEVDFEVLPLLHSVSGICRFYLKQVRPHFQLYVTPVNINPASPALPITTPDHYAEELAEEIGPFYTQGIPEDTKALSEEVLTDEEFMQQANLVLAEELKMFEYELHRFKAGVLFFYIGRTDQLAHMFWRTMDPHHPAHDPTTHSQSVIEQAYRDVDNVLGKALETLDEQTTLIVLSDHGFAPFYRAFNLNTWLKNEGYASLTDDAEGELLRNVNWARTRAYGVGFNGLSLNLRGRERRGVVRAGAERQKLLNEIAQKLLAVHDPKTGERVFLKVHKAEELYSGPYVKNAPDLILGYNKGYRASWETVLGKFPKELLRDNTEKWSGDHLMEAELVPGILLANKKITTERPALSDLAPTVLAEFGVAKQDGMIGNGLFQTH